MRTLKAVFGIAAAVVLAAMMVALVTAYPPTGQRAFDLAVLLGSTFALGWYTGRRIELAWSWKWAWGLKRYPKPDPVTLPGWKRQYLWIRRIGFLEIRRRDLGEL